MPNFLFEQRCGFDTVAGVDEAGCGPWSGPVVASAVIFFEYDEGTWIGLDDSKKLSKKKREVLYENLTNSNKLTYSVGIASVEEIDMLNIANATCLAMGRAIDGLSVNPNYVLVDGIRKPKVTIPYELIIKGDSKSISIAAASIIAKVTRDQIMGEISKAYPEYGWSKNAGYGTATHMQALNLYGITPHHRKSFAPIRKLMEKLQ